MHNFFYDSSLVGGRKVVLSMLDSLCAIKPWENLSLELIFSFILTDLQYKMHLFLYLKFKRSKFWASSSSKKLSPTQGNEGILNLPTITKSLALMFHLQI